MNRNAIEFIIFIYLLLAAAITSFVAASETASITVRIVASVLTLLIFAAMGVMSWVSKRWRKGNGK